MEKQRVFVTQKSNGCDVDDYVDTEYDSELVEDEEDLESIDYDEL